MFDIPPQYSNTLPKTDISLRVKKMINQINESNRNLK